MRHAHLRLAPLLSAALLAAGCSVIVDPSQLEPDADASGAPTVQATSPAAGATGVAVTADIQLLFSRAMDRASVEAAFGATPAITCNWGWSSGDTIATCSHATALAANTTYALTLSASARDANATPLAAPHSFTFTTAAVDLTPPTVSGTAPANLAQGVSPATAIAVTFSEPVNQGSAQGAFSIQAPSGHDAGTFTWSTDGRTMTFQPDVPFTSGDTVNVRVTTAVTDLAGNAMALEVNFSFQVAQPQVATLYAVPALDGMVWSSTYVYTDLAYLYAGDNSQDYYGRAFVTFDLGALPAGTTAVTGATLELYQEGGTGSPYAALGSLSAEYLQYGSSLDSADLDLPAFGSFPLSSTAAIEWKTADVGTAVANAWNNRAALSNRAQFRLRFATDGDADATADYAILTSGDSTINRPRLVVTYLAP